MTQQDETSQGAATDQPVPSRPSPYLDAGESVPQAYLAPPQTGKPSYGAPPGYRPGLRLRGSSQQPYTQPGQGQQPGNGQQGYGQPASRRFGGAQPRRDPAIASPWERLAACTVDWIIIFGVSVVVFWSPLLRVARELNAITATYKEGSSPAAQAALDSIFRNPANAQVLLHWAYSVFGIALAYYWAQHAAWGATVGKRIFGVRVVRAADQSRIGIKAAGIRAVAYLVGPAILWVLPGISLLGGVLWAADSGMALLDPRAQCLHDKLAGTIVIRQRWLDRQQRSASPW
ncbi:MAG TPA: RDD family protein [Streptosporangiaceae bacterium]|jgi:uncharacterized RDD family membrane protein YckC|nr:RDD family protein [Streptosporangiaceae bacterium]